ncbi:glycosyltransferase family 4 protein [Methanothermococcus sp. SCGC AD-155-C09]|nr:glycosyltransferase family 4 protein [Methanothermococcus sp. SCGC AD-155-C09]
MSVIYILNSDYGVRNTIGARTKPIVDEAIKREYNHHIICRGHYKKLNNNYNLKQVFPFSDKIMKVLTAIPIFIYKNFPAEDIKNYLFEYFTMKKIENINLEKYNIIHSWDFLPKLYRLIKEKNNKIKIVQDVPMAFPKALNERERIYLWGKRDIEISSYIKKSLQYIDYFVVPSEFVKKSLINEGVDKDKIFVVPFGVDTVKFKPVEKDYFGTFKVAFSGNVNLRKGIPFLIRAWKELRLEDAELNIYGIVYPEVKKYLTDGEKYNIKVHGFLRNIDRVLPKNHVYVFPSLLEGSAKSIYEAMACGLPVITTENSGSIVENGKEGFIIPTLDVKSMKEKILFFYENKEEIKKFGKRARKKSERYTWERYGGDIVNMYDFIGG